MSNAIEFKNIPEAEKNEILELKKQKCDIGAQRYAMQKLDPIKQLPKRGELARQERVIDAKISYLCNSIKCALAIILFAPLSSFAAYPDKPVTLVIPFAAGGPTDAIARALQSHLSEALRTPVIIDNSAGAGGTIGTRKVVNAKGDGYTILLTNLGITTAPSLYKNLGYDPRKDLQAIGSVVDVPMVIVSRKDLPAKDLKELNVWMKASGDKVNYGNAGVGSASHLCGVLLQSDQKTKFTEVSYKGTGPAILALMAGEVDIICDQWANVTQHVKAGTIKAYSTTAKVVDFPALPLYLGLSAWHGVYAPKGTPPEAVKTLSTALQKALATPDFMARMQAVNTQPASQQQATPAALTARTASEVERWGQLMTAAGVEKQ